MRGTVRTLRAVQWTMLGSILFYAVIGEVLGRGARAIDPSLSYVFTTAGVAIVGMIFVVRRTLGAAFRGKSGRAPRRLSYPAALEEWLHHDLRVMRGPGVVWFDPALHGL
jgi:hypothetical protein